MLAMKFADLLHKLWNFQNMFATAWQTSIRDKHIWVIHCIVAERLQLPRWHSERARLLGFFVSVMTVTDRACLFSEEWLGALR